MERRRQREIALGAFAVVAIAFAVYMVRSPAPAASVTNQSGRASSGTAGTAGTTGSAKPSPQNKPAELDLSTLNAPKAAPQEFLRNPFRFKPKPAPPPPPPPPAQVRSGLPLQPAGPVGPPPPPPIPYKFFGIIDVPGKGLNASLTDGRGVYRGFVGDTIEGRYRILRIGVESIDLAYLDGRGRQTIRFTGQ